MTVSPRKTLVLGFVPIYPVDSGGYEHLAGTTIRCRFSADAEGWLEGLVKHGLYRSWAPAVDGKGCPLEYRGARVFRVEPTTPRRTRRGDMIDAELVAVWEW